MSRIYCLLFSFLFIGSIQAQDFSYQVKKNVKWKLISSVNMSDDFEDFHVVNPKQMAPEPWSKTKALKQKLDAQRQRKYSKLHKSHQIKETGDQIKPQLNDEFNGMPRGSAGVPNDNNMAISNDGHVVSVINSTITMMDDTGAVLMYRTLRSVVRGALPNLNRTYDPKIVYDPMNDRFILIFLQGSTSGDTRIVTGFSQTSDPTQLWNFYAVDGNPFKRKTWSDYPIIGINEEDLYITVNILRDGESWQEGFEQSVIWQINKESGLTGQDTLNSNLFHDLKYKNKSIWSMCIVPTGNFESKWNDYGEPHMHFLSVRPDAESNDTLFVQTIYGTAASGKERYEFHTRTTSKPYGVPPSAFQKQIGFRLQTNDTRVLSAFEQDGYIQYVQSTIIPETGMPGIFHGVFDINSKSEEVTANYIQSDTFEYAYPSIAYLGDANRDAASVITFSHTSELDFPGTSAVFYNGINGVDQTYSSVIKVKEGEGLINTFVADSMERWGDYTAIQTKYNENGVVYLCGSHGKSNDANGTWIGKLSISRKMNTVNGIEDVVVFPNPVNGSQRIISLLLEVDREQEFKFQIVNLDGKLIVELESQMVYEGVNTLKLNPDDIRIKSLQSGMYFIKVLSSEEDVIATEKFILTSQN